MTKTSKSKPEHPNHKNAFWIVRRLWSEHIQGYLLRLALAFGLITLLAVTESSYPIIIKYSYDMLSKGDLSLLWLILIVIVAVTSFKGVVDYLQSVVTSRISIDLGLDMQKRLFAHILHADFARLMKEPPGQLLSRIGNDLGAIQNAIMSVFTTAIRDVMRVLALVGSMFYLDWVMTLLVLLIYPLAVIPIASIGRVIRKNAYKTAQQSGNSTSVLVEHLSSPRLIKTFRLENYAIMRMNSEFERVNNLRLKTIRIRAALNPILEAFAGAAIAGVIGIAAHRIAYGHKTVGDFMGFVTALLMAAQALRSFASLNSKI